MEIFYKFVKYIISKCKMKIKGQEKILRKILSEIYLEYRETYWSSKFLIFRIWCFGIRKKEEERSIPDTNLLEYFKHSNSKESHQYAYGVYLTGDFKSDKQRGADIISMWWYNRNLRIFRNIQDMTEGKEDRIL